MLVIFSVYLLLAFSSFFFTGAADQSIIDSGNPADLSVVDNHVRTMLVHAEHSWPVILINDCFGISSFFILVFLAVAGLKLMRVRVVRLWNGLSDVPCCWSGSPFSLDLLSWSIIRILSSIWGECTDTMSAVG